MLLPAVVYILWDIYFTAQQVWSFSSSYTIGIQVANLPIEEVLFFFIVPYCCVFIYECVCSYFPRLQNKKWADKFLILLAAALAITAIVFFSKRYTSYTFLGLSFFILIIFLLKNYLKSFDAVSFIISYCIILIPFLFVNGFLTAIPVVSYNNAENLGIRIYTIPFEDVFYGMLLILMNIVFYEKLKTQYGIRKGA